MGADEKVEATFHPGRSPWTDEDVEAVARADWKAYRDMGADMVPWDAAQPWDQEANRQVARAVLAALAPRVDALVRAGQVEALREFAEGWRREHRAQEPIWPQQILWHADDIERGQS